MGLIKKKRRLNAHRMLTPCFCSTCECAACFALLFVSACAAHHMPSDCVVGSISDSGRSYEKSFCPVWWRDPLSVAFIRLSRALNWSMWHGSAPLCVVRLRFKAATQEDGGLILVLYHPCCLCRQVTCRVKKTAHGLHTKSLSQRKTSLGVSRKTTSPLFSEISLLVHTGDVGRKRRRALDVDELIQPVKMGERSQNQSNGTPPKLPVQLEISQYQLFLSKHVLG